MGRKKLAARLDPNNPFLCYVCGDKARGNNFSVLSCVSCKSFFRRHGLLKLENLRCKYGDNCMINKGTRNKCLRCRLKKSLECGMDPRMIRCPSKLTVSSTKTEQPVTTNNMQLQLPMLRPLNLLQNDSSTLTRDQWHLLSNIICSYDEHNIINRVKYTLRLVNEPLQNILPLMENSPHVRSLSTNAHRSLNLHNMFLIGGLNGYFVARETSAFKNPVYMTATSLLYGHDYMMKCAIDNERLVPNGNLLKLMLFVLVFSSNCSIVVFNEEETIEIISSSKELVETQNIYVIMLWKYLIYLYGHDGAVTFFSSMIKNSLDMLSRMEEILNNSAYLVLADKLAIDTKRSLNIED